MEGRGKRDKAIELTYIKPDKGQTARVLSMSIKGIKYL